MNAPEDIPFNTVLRSLSICYVMPNQKDKENWSKFFIIGTTIKIVSFVCFVIGAFLHYLNVVRVNIEEMDASEDVVVVSGGIGILLIVSIFTYLHKHWEKLLCEVLDYSKYGKPKKIDFVVRRSNVLGKWIEYYCILGCVGYAVFSFKEADCNKINEAKNLHFVCNTFVPIWLPFDVPKPFRFLIFVIQMILVTVAVIPAAMICFLCYECTEILGLHIEALKSHFKKIIVAKNVRYRPDGLGYWVQYHNHILRLAEDLRMLVKKSLSHLTLISALVFGCTENQLVKGVKPFGALIFFIGWLVALLLVCHAGERLSNFTLSIHDTITESSWYLADSKIQKDVVFILLMCQKPVYLDALPFGAMNYSLFLMMLRTSYSYMTLLNHSM